MMYHEASFRVNMLHNTCSYFVQNHVAVSWL